MVISEAYFPLLNTGNTLRGIPNHTKITVANATDADAITNTDTTNGNSNIIVEGIELDGNDTGQTTAGFGIRIVGTSGNVCDNIKILNNYVYDCYLAGIEAEYCTNIEIANNRANSNGGVGTSRNGIALNYGCVDVWNHHNITNSNTGTGNGWERDSCERVVYTDNIAASNSKNGHIVGYVTDDSVVANCIATDNTQRGFKLGGEAGSVVERVALSNCYTTGNGYQGF